MNINEFGHELADMLSKYDVDYIEAHLEENQSSHLAYRGKELESMDKTGAVGGNIRALVKGGWGFVSFNSLDNLKAKVEQAVEQARYVSGGDARIEPVKPVVDSVTGEMKQNPVDISLAEKKQSWMSITLLSGALPNFRPRLSDTAMAIAGIFT